MDILSILKDKKIKLNDTIMPKQKAAHKKLSGIRLSTLSRRQERQKPKGIPCGIGQNNLLCNTATT
jgi:hypothetical protein